MASVMVHAYTERAIHAPGYISVAQKPTAGYEVTVRTPGREEGGGRTARIVLNRDQLRRLRDDLTAHLGE